MKKCYKIEDGKLISGSGKTVPKGYETDWSKLQRKEDGTYATWYNDDFTINTVKENEDAKTKAELEAKKSKEAMLKSLIVTANNVNYDAHQDAVDNLNGVAILALFEGLNVLLTEEQYNAIFKQQVDWKGAENDTHTVQVESIFEALNQVMLERKTIYGV